MRSILLTGWLALAGVGLAAEEGDWRTWALALTPKQRAELMENRGRLREWALDVYSDAVLARQAEALGLAHQAEIAARVQRAKQRILAEALLERAAAETSVPEAKLEALARERYALHKEKLRLPERRKVAHILLRDRDDCPCAKEPPALERAQTLRAELVSSQREFAQAARELSQDPGSASKGGVLGWVVRDGQLVKPFEDAVFALAKVGDISQPVVSPYGVHLIQLLELEPARQLSFAEVKSRLIAQIQAEQRANAMEQKRSQAYPDPETLDLEQLAKMLKELAEAQ